MGTLIGSAHLLVRRWREVNLSCSLQSADQGMLHWLYLSRSSGLAKTILQGTVKRGMKTRQTEKEVGRQHQGVDRPGVRQVPEGSGEQRKMEETGCEVICCAPTTPAVKGEVKVWCPNDPRGQGRGEGEGDSPERLRPFNLWRSVVYHRLDRTLFN